MTLFVAKELAEFVMKAVQACHSVEPQHCGSCLCSLSEPHATLQACDIILAQPDCIGAAVCISSAKLSAPDNCA